MLDTGHELMPGMGLSSDRHEWLGHALAEPRGAPVFVFMHKSPLRGEGDWWWHAMWDRGYARGLRRDFERAGVRMVFAGHRHTHEVQARRGVTYVTVRAPEAVLGFEPIWPETAAAPSR